MRASPGLAFRHTFYIICFWGGGGFRPQRAGEALSPEGTQEISRNQGSELSDATIVPQGGAVADTTRRGDELNLTPGNAARSATPVGIPVCYWGTTNTTKRKILGTTTRSSGCEAVVQRQREGEQTCAVRLTAAVSRAALGARVVGRNKLLPTPSTC